MRKRVCIFGDSIVRGNADREGGGRATRLRLTLETADPELFVFPLGVGGNTVEDLLKRFFVEATARKPSMIIFSIGINDTKQTFPDETPMVTQEEFVRNYQLLIDQAKTITSNIRCMGLTAIDKRRIGPDNVGAGEIYRTQERVVACDALIQQIAQKNDLRYIDMYTLLTPDELIDGPHPTTQGHIKIYEYMLRMLAGETFYEH